LLDVDAASIKERVTSKAEKRGFNFDGNLGDYDALFDTLAAERVELGKLKIDPACQYIKDVLDGGVDQLVVFAHHLKVLKSVEEYLINNGISCVRVDGSTDKRELQPAVDSFQSGKTRIFLGSHGACGVGLTLTAASQMVVIEPQWNPATLSQSEDRLHRIGQKNSVQIDYLVVKDSVDSFVLDKVIAKAQVESSALDGVEVGEVPSIEDIKERIVNEKSARQELLNSKKSHEVDNAFREKYLNGKYVTAVVDVGGELKELVKAKDGKFYLDGEPTNVNYLGKIFHTGKCSACGRTLTDPESISRGLGPICAGTK
jgi:hypothetical protein